jgi:tRNA dimethylallyltransferase
MPERPLPLVFLLGATGTGKTDLALALAKAFPAGVINLDSRQVYRDFPIVTAQPTAEEQSQCPHRLYGFLDSREKVAAGVFAERCNEEIRAFAAEGRLSLLVGGAGLYLRALLEGLAPIPRTPPELMAALLRALEKQGLPALRRRLEQLDPEYAAKIHPNDTQRTLRALEVFEHTGKSFSWWHKQPTGAPSYRPLKLGLSMSLEALRPRLGARIERMLEAGALDEIRQAHERCPDRSAPAWSGIGCAELLAWRLGEISLDHAKDLWLKNTRAYAKRQLTWFKCDADILWRPADAPDLAAASVETVGHFLNDAHL